MSATESITRWIDQLKSGDSQAAQRLWEEYFQRMVELAHSKLAGARRAVADEEDVALSAFKSFCLGARAGRFTRLVDRDNLWPLLMAITLHKSVDAIRGENRLKRGGTGGPVDGGSADTTTRTDEASPGRRPLAGGGLPAATTSLSEILSREPNPAFAAEMAEQLGQLLLRLDATGDPDLRTIALGKMQGYSTREIASQMQCVSRTVERKLQLIARLWEKQA